MRNIRKAKKKKIFIYSSTERGMINQKLKNKNSEKYFFFNASRDCLPNLQRIYLCFLIYIYFFNEQV